MKIISIFNAGSAGKCKPKGLLGSICGMKFNDANGNGTQDTGELGLSDWEISLTYLLSGVSTTVKTTTGADGSYCFNDLAAGIYTIKETPKDNWVQKYPVPGTYSITLTTGQKVIDKNFGNYLCNLTITGHHSGITLWNRNRNLGSNSFRRNDQLVFNINRWFIIGNRYFIYHTKHFNNNNILC